MKAIVHRETLAIGQVHLTPAGQWEAQIQLADEHGWVKLPRAYSTQRGAWRAASNAVASLLKRNTPDGAHGG
jgi:hypothetical protein